MNRIRRSGAPYFKLIQSNTDGIALELLTDDAEELIDRVCVGWEKDWRFILEKTVADNLYEKDVNNYVFRDNGGGIKVKALVCCAQILVLVQLPRTGERR